MTSPTSTPPEVPIFSPRLDEVLAEMIKGQAPNRGHFCGHCYTPLAEDRRACPHCSVDTARWPPVEQVPSEVIAMFRALRRRESIVVNSFAFLGLFLGVALFLGLFLVSDALWWRIVDIVILVVASRFFAAILGGALGDEVGYRFARRRLAREWREFAEKRRKQELPGHSERRTP
jgi:hypothetical protein